MSFLNTGSFVLRGAIVAVFVFAAASVNAQNWELRYDPPIGEVLKYRTQTLQEMDMDLGPMGGQKMSNDISMTMTQVAREKVGSDFRLESVIESMIMDVKQGGASIMHWDSNAPEAGDASELGEMSALIDQTFETVMSDRGEVRSVSGLDAMWDAMAESDDPMMKQQAQMMKQGLGDESMVAMMQGSMPVFPEHALETGDSWTWDAQAPNPILGELAMKSTYTVAGASEVDGTPCLELLVDIDMSMGGASQMLDQLAASFGGEMTMDMDVKEASGTMCLSRDTGVLLTSRMHQVMTVDIAISAPGEEAMNMRIGIDQNITMELE